MHAKKSLTIFAFALSTAIAQKPAGPVNDKEAARLLRLTEADQKAYINSAFDHGLPQDSMNTVTSLLRARSEMLAPVLGARLQETLKSATPLECFVDKTVDPPAVIMAGASAIAYAADEHALKELSKLLAVDERRFGWLIGYALSDGGSRNFFPVAYDGFAFGSAALDAKMAAWIEKQLDEDASSGEPQLRSWWADALVDKLGHAPSAAEWANDPIVKRLKPELAKSLRDEVIRLAAEEAQRRTEHRP